MSSAIQKYLIKNFQLKLKRLKFSPSLYCSNTDKSSSNEILAAYTTDKNSHRTVVYRFQGIGFYSFVSRAKYFQTIASLFLLPYSYYLFLCGHFNILALVGVSVATVIAPITMVFFTRYFNRIVGEISIDPSEAVTTFSHLSFTGRRKDIQVELSKLVPLRDTARLKKGFLKLYFQTSTGYYDYLLVSTLNSKIFDERLAGIIFHDTRIFKKQSNRESLK